MKESLGYFETNSFKYFVFKQRRHIGGKTSGWLKWIKSFNKTTGEKRKVQVNQEQVDNILAEFKEGKVELAYTLSHYGKNRRRRSEILNAS